MKRWLLGALALVVVTLAVGAALLRWTDILRTTASIRVENQTFEAVDIGISDTGIGCTDSASVAANTTAQVKLTFRGDTLDILCLGDPIDIVWVTTSDGTDYPCYWSGFDDGPPVIVVTNGGPDCR